MNEPKRRGRPPKASVEAMELIQAADVLVEAHEAHEAHVGPRLLAQAYALRVWAGQSESLSRHERLGRVADALKAQGLSMDGVEL
jgi:hypothetical protein